MMTAEENGFVLASAENFSLKKTFECGQCFRWNLCGDGTYEGVAYGRVLRIWEENGRIVCAAKDEDIPFWRDYFDLETDYAEISVPFSEPPYLKICAEFGRGIRILKQEPWETLCSFIISQCNNIPRIKRIISAMCRLFGEELEYGLYSFPSAQRIASLSEKDLSPLRCGYRTAYILDAARYVSSGMIDFDVLSKIPSDEAFAAIKKINGVGSKVADCFLLYGLHKMDRFPVDVWMKRALKEHFPEDYDPRVLGPHAGLAQQYIFYYTRTGGIS